MTQRPIKFRAWDIHKKRMMPVKALSFDYCEDTGFKGEEIGVAFGEPYQEEISAKNVKAWDVANHHPVVDTCILMQFTGLHDKNGVEIWEGDVVRIEHWRENPPKDTPMRHDIETVAVKWQIASFNIRLERYLNGDTYEVIGNIYSGLLPEYENPDMIESWKNITNKPYQNPSKDIPSVKKLDERLD